MLATINSIHPGRNKEPNMIRFGQTPVNSDSCLPLGPGKAVPISWSGRL